MSPIRPENMRRYPHNWNEIRNKILERAKNRCEWPDCGVRNGDIEIRRGRPVKVVLTIAHLDHTSEHCDPTNLRAWCQKHHNAYDAKMRAAGRKELAIKTDPQESLFD